MPAFPGNHFLMSFSAWILGFAGLDPSGELTQGGALSHEAGPVTISALRTTCFLLLSPGKSLGEGPPSCRFLWAPRSKGRGLCPHQGQDIKGSCSWNSPWSASTVLGTSEELRATKAGGCVRESLALQLRALKAQESVVHVLALHGCRARERPARLSPIAYSKEPVRGEAPAPATYRGQERWSLAAAQGKKGWLDIHCQGHVHQQICHWAAQKPQPPGQQALRAGRIPGDRQVSGGPGEEREGRIPEKCLSG